MAENVDMQKLFEKPLGTLQGAGVITALAIIGLLFWHGEPPSDIHIYCATGLAALYAVLYFWLGRAVANGHKNPSDEHQRIVRTAAADIPPAGDGLPINAKPSLHDGSDEV